MMKGYRAIFSVALSVLLLSGGVTNFSAKADSDNLTQKKMIVTDPKLDSSKEIFETFETITDRQVLPKKLQTEIMTLKTKRGYFVLDNEEFGLKDSKKYIFISSGEQKVGFGIKLEQIANTKGNISIQVKETTPSSISTTKDLLLSTDLRYEKEEVVYPNILIKLDKDFNYIDVINTNKEVFNPMLEGNVDSQEIVNLDNINDKVKNKIEALKISKGYYIFDNKDYDFDNKNYDFKNKKANSISEQDLNSKDINLNENYSYLLVCIGESPKGTILKTKSVDNGLNKTVISIIENYESIDNSNEQEKSYPYVLLKIKNLMKDISIKEIKTDSIEKMK